MPEQNTLLTIGEVARLLNVHPRTLRNYEGNGLIAPIRKGTWRYYSPRDVQWLACLRNMIHQQGMRLVTIRRILQHTPCWRILDCEPEKRTRCSAFLASGLVIKKVERKRMSQQWC